VGLPSISLTRVAAALSVVALVLFTVSDFFLTEFWDENAMFTSVVADVLVLIVGVAVLNEFLAARSRQRWRLLADYAMAELSSSCRLVWVRLAEAIGLGRREELTSDAFRELVRSPAEEERSVERAAAMFAETAESRGDLHQEISTLVRSTRSTLTSWAAVLVETPYSRALSRYVEMQAQLSELELVLWEEAEGKRPSYSGTGNPEWIAARISSLIELGAELEVELHRAATTMEVKAPT
jgi:hypothetical protein